MTTYNYICDKHTNLDTTVIYPIKSMSGKMFRLWRKKSSWIFESRPYI